MAKGRINPFAAIAKKKLDLKKIEPSEESLETIKKEESNEGISVEIKTEDLSDEQANAINNTNITSTDVSRLTSIKKAKSVKKQDVNLQSTSKILKKENSLLSRTKTIHVNATVWNKLRKQMVLMDVEKSIQQVTEDALSYYVDNVLLK